LRCLHLLAILSFENQDTGMIKHGRYGAHFTEVSKPNGIKEPHQKKQ
jgi:hypothetical protein